MEHYIITKDLQLYNAKDTTTALQLKHLECDTSEFVEKFGIDLPDIEKDVYNINVSAWIHFYNNSHEEYCLITEEGVDLQLGINEIKTELGAAKGKWEVFFPYDKIHFTSNNYPISVSRFGFYWGTYCYFINKVTVPKLLNSFRNITGPLDEVLLEGGINKDIRFMCAQTEWFRYDQSSCSSLKARKGAINDYVRKYRIWEDKEIEQIRGILQYLSNLAAEIGIKFFLHAGTLLGAIRHGKIMDWDDDVDLMIKSEDLKLLIDRILRDKRYNVLKREWKKTGKFYYKIWKSGGFMVDGYEYTFPFVDIWLLYSDKKNQSVETNDGYNFRYDTYFPLSVTLFEDATFYLPHKSEDILDLMYKGWRKEIKIFSWSHKLKQHTVRQMTAFIKTDETGRFVNFK